MKIEEYNKKAWNGYADNNIKWSVPVSKEQIEKAQNGNIQMSVTITKLLPEKWLDVKGKDVLCLASGGGQQATLLAAAGANVTVIDISDKQIKRDIQTAKEYNLDIKTYVHDIQDLDFLTETYDLIINPVSLTYIPNPKLVFEHVNRLLKVNGYFIMGAPNPLIYLFDEKIENKENKLQVKNKLPYNSLDENTIEELGTGAIEYSHTLSVLIGEQLKHGLVITDFYEDKHQYLIDEFTDTYFVTRAIKLK